ncbi:tripartite tricarboxylate transporter permease [Radiobacillus sp. PE A8.2]|uniref:tripartite tricarboxylate transporter permease n=1 Tax=Radiobacillus sp. PE A8.2 TaxID=3380349 RepID=UPI00389093E7
MDIFNFDLMSLFTINNILMILLGTFVGLIFGAIPGLGTMVAIILLFPLTYGMSPLASVLMLVAAYQASEYGGSISSIILGIPGTPAAAATLLDGNTLAKNESPGKALTYSLTASTVGGLIGGIVLIFLCIPLAKFATKLSDPEFFLIGVLGLIAVGMLSTKDKLKSMISVVLGLMIGTVGLDLLTGMPRVTFGSMQLMDGINLIALLIGVFALSELFNMINTGLNKRQIVQSERLKTGLTAKEYKRIIKPMGLGSIVGSITGIFPGLGAGAASWFGYTLVKKFSKTKDTFGKGNPEGIAGPESANNAVVGGALVPLLALGIPGSASTAIILGTFIVHGIQPGPNVLSTNSDLIYGIFYGFLLTTIAMYIVGRFVTAFFSRILTIPNAILVPIILIFCAVGVYISKSLYFDLWFALITGVIFFILHKLEFSLPSVILAFILCPIIEESLRRTLVISDGSYSVFITRPFSLLLCLVILGIIILGVVQRFRKNQSKSNSDETVKL